MLISVPYIIGIYVLLRACLSICILFYIEVIYQIGIQFIKIYNNAKEKQQREKPILYTKAKVKRNFSFVC